MIDTRVIWILEQPIMATDFFSTSSLRMLHHQSYANEWMTSM